MGFSLHYKYAPPVSEGCKITPLANFMLLTLYSPYSTQPTIATMVHHRFLLVVFNTHSHLNPALQFAKRLIAMGAHVTLVMTVHMHRRMHKKPTIPGLSLATYSDGHDDGFKIFTSSDEDYKLHALEIERRGSEFLTNLIASSAKEGHPFTCLTYTLLNPWAHEVARGFHLPTALLWIEPATVFDIAYYCFHGYDNYFNRKIKEEPKSCSIAVPGLPLLLSPSDMPTFLLPSRSKAMSFMFQLIEKQFRLLDKDTKPRVLVNTFEALEPEAMRAVDRLNMLSVGPLVPSAFLGGKDPSDTSFGGDMFKASNDCLEWLESKAEASVVYVSFGSYFELSKRQKEEIARGLLDFGHPFLWVIRENSHVEGKAEVDQEELCWRKELESKGKVVKWCSQVEVLSHPSLGCFVTHCGWNSTMESLVSGVPMVAFPQWADQKTNAKLIEDVWKTGMRVDHKVDEEGILQAEDIRRFLDVVMGSGEKGIELKMNAKKWKILAKEAGSSQKNLRAFLDDITQEYMTKK